MNGKTEAGGPDVRTDSTPWLSSSACTTLASIFEAVRKTTVNPVIVNGGRAGVCHLQQNHRHVVVLIGRAGERAQVREDERPQLIERQVRILLEHLGQAILAVAVERLVHRFADAVGEKDDEIVGRQRHRDFLNHRIEHRPIVNLEAEHETVRRNQLGLAQAGGRRARHANQRTVPGARERHGPLLEIDDAVGHGDEALGIDIVGDDAVDRLEKLARATYACAPATGPVLSAAPCRGRPAAPCQRRRR